MLKKSKILGLIPARGGSKGIKRKNLRPLLGKPLITWTISEALKSKYIDRIIVSTDDEEIARTCKREGAEVPFLRPKKLATDNASSVDVILHALASLQKKGYSPDVVMLLQPTSPLRTQYDIDKSLELFFDRKCKSLVSVREAPNYLFWSFEIENEYLKPVIGEDFLNKNRQNLPKVYIPNGAIYIASVKYFIENKSFYGQETSYYIMPEERSIDIDTELDFMMAELIMEKMKKVNNRM